LDLVTSKEVRNRIQAGQNDVKKGENEEILFKELSGELEASLEA
jgi:hypothetical protein